MNNQKQTGSQLFFLKNLQAQLQWPTSAIYGEGAKADWCFLGFG